MTMISASQLVPIYVSVNPKNVYKFVLIKKCQNRSEAETLVADLKEFAQNPKKKKGVSNNVVSLFQKAKKIAKAKKLEFRVYDLTIPTYRQRKVGNAA